jgi:hypothetical protein
MKNLPFSFLALLMSTCILTSCVKQKPDTPPDLSHYDPQIPVSGTINTLLALNPGSNNFKVDSDMVIAVVVSADDRSGNLYKQMVVQDFTDSNSVGLTVYINATNLYNDYPVGRKLYIKCKGLYIGYDNGLPVMGNTPNEQQALTGISGDQLANYIVTADIGHPVIPRNVTMAEISTVNPVFLNRLIRITDAEFADAEIGKTYTDPTAATNRTLQDCNGKTIVVRSSNFANFNAIPLPSGRGSLTGVYTVFRTTPQMIIRDTTDVQLKNTRCDGSTGSAVTLLNESFGSLADNAVVTLAGWDNIPVQGTVKYIKKTFSSISYASITAFSTGQANVESWLITPVLDLSGKTSGTLSFNTIDGFDNGATFKVWVTTNYSGNPATTTWQQLPATISSGHTSGYGNWTASGNVDLSSYMQGNVRIGFQYVGAASGASTTYELTAVKVTAE